LVVAATQRNRNEHQTNRDGEHEAYDKREIGA